MSGCLEKEYHHLLLQDRMSSSYAKKSFPHQKDLVRNQHIINGEKMLKCHLCPYESARKDKLVSHQKMRTKSSSDQALNGNSSIT